MCTHIWNTHIHTCFRGRWPEYLPAAFGFCPRWSGKASDPAKKIVGDHRDRGLETGAEWHTFQRLRVCNGCFMMFWISDVTTHTYIYIYMHTHAYTVFWMFWIYTYMFFFFFWGYCKASVWQAYMHMRTCLHGHAIPAPEAPARAGQQAAATFNTWTI